MKIGIFMPSLQEGGVQKVVVNMYNGFHQKKVYPTIIACDGSGELSDKFDKNDIIDFKKTKYHGDYKCLFSFGNLVKVMKKYEFDSIIAVPGFSTIILLLAKKIARSNIKIVLMVDNTISILKTGKLKHKISFYLYKRFYKYADKIVVAHNVGKKDIMKNFNLTEEKVIKIYHPMIDFDYINSVDKVKHKFINKENYVIFAAGRLCEEKNFTDLISAFKMFKNKVNNARLIIAGAGNQFDLINDKIISNNLTKYVDMIGFSNDVIGFMKSCNLYVLSSKQEAFGIVLVEALACGMQIVSTDCKSGAQREILEDGKYGYICNVNDINDLYNKMILAYNDAKHISKQRCINRANDFTIQKSTAEYVKLLEELCK